MDRNILCLGSDKCLRARSSVEYHQPNSGMTYWRPSGITTAITIAVTIAIAVAITNCQFPPITHVDRKWFYSR